MHDRTSGRTLLVALASREPVADESDGLQEGDE